MQQQSLVFRKSAGLVIYNNIKPKHIIESSNVDIYIHGYAVSTLCSVGLSMKKHYNLGPCV